MEPEGGDSLLTRFLARLPLSPQFPPLLSRIAKCAKSANTSAASSSSFTITGSAAPTETDDDDDEDDAGELRKDLVVSELNIFKNRDRKYKTEQDKRLLLESSKLKSVPKRYCRVGVF